MSAHNLMKLDNISQWAIVIGLNSYLGVIIGISIHFLYLRQEIVKKKKKNSVSK